MPFINDNVLDSGLSWAKTNSAEIHICSSEPANVTALSSATLGKKDFGAGSVFPNAIAAGSPSGRKISTAAVTDGSVTGNGTASHWAIATASTAALVAASSLSGSQSVSSGNTFTLTSFDVRLPGTGG